MDQQTPEKSPWLPSWKAWYVVVLLALAVEILLFGLLTNYFS